jgi:hypothetical protein
MFDGDQIKEDDTNSACIMHRRNYKCIYKLLGKCKGKSILGVQSVDQRVILKWT